MSDVYLSLTEREKDVLRLLAEGHDAKSVATTLGISVHTVNERLRAARRKLGVGSSRAAARLLASAEATNHLQTDPQFLGPKKIGGAGDGRVEQQSPQAKRPSTLWVGLLGGSLMIGLIAAVLVAFTGSAPPQQEAAAPVPAQQVILPEARQAAEHWLDLMDKGRWQESWAQSAAAFKTATDAPAWQVAASSARSNFGQPESREMTAAARTKALPGAPDGDYHLFQFKARYSQAEAVETVVMSLEDGQWKGSGYFIR
jgi:DNA-binding CsgD family transcriptional regulator